MIRLLTVSAVALGLTACGGSKLGGGEQGAAQAAFQASQPAGRGHNSKTGKALIEQAMSSGALSVKVSAKCSESGSVELEWDASAQNKLGTISYVIRYKDCNEDGQNEYNGEMATTMGIGLDIDSHTALGGFFIDMKGRLTIDGEISDFIDTDVRMSMEFAATSLRTGSVKVTVDGTIETSNQKYTYSKQVIATSAGSLPRG
ncbi:MAG: hypothetical protein ABW123_15275 [Cystobacter sp.]